MLLEETASVGEIASELGVRMHRVIYVMSLLDIEPAVRIGGRCLYERSRIPEIANEIQHIDSRKRKSRNPAATS